MAKRFTSTEIWEEDWFLDMPNEYKLFWYYMLSNCDHAGIYKVNLRSFCSLLEVKVSPKEILDKFNTQKQRIRVIAEYIWFIEDFFIFQYGHIFNINNPLHKGIKRQLDRYGIELTSIRGLLEVNLTTKDKEKDKEIKKGGSGENKIVGVEFINGAKVKLSDDSVQTLGKNQKIRMLHNDIQPQEILKGKIY